MEDAISLWQEESGQDYTTLTADLVDGRKIMIVKFFKPGKIESFTLQLQSNLYDQGFSFEDRLKYSDLCNKFISEENQQEAFLLKRENYLIILLR